MLFFLIFSNSECRVNQVQRRKKEKVLKLSMDKAVGLYALLGLFAGAIISSCICETPRNYKAKNDCTLLGKIGEFSLLQLP